MNTTETTVTVPAFGYVHRSRCGCSGNPRRYAEQRATALAAIRDRLINEGCADDTAYDLAERRLPEGACIAWLYVPAARNVGQYPADRRDHHVLSLYRAAIAVERVEAAIRDAAKALSDAHVVSALAPLREAARLDREAAIASGETERSPWVVDNASFADPVLLTHGPTSAIGRAETVSYEARQALGAAMIAAPWGQQADGTFLTERRFEIGSPTMRRELHLPGKGGVVARVDFEEGESYGSVTLYAPDAAAKKAQQNRHKNGVAGQTYEQARQAAGAALAEGKSLPFCQGQLGGFVEVGEHRVSARGALVAAGLTKADAQAVLDRFAAGDTGTGETTYEDSPDGGFVSRFLGTVLRLSGPTRVVMEQHHDAAGNPVGQPEAA